MPEFRRYIRLSEEASYGTAGASPSLYLDLAGESLKRKPRVGSIRAERRVAADRQSDRGRSVAGSLDVYLGYVGLARTLRWLCSTPTEESLGVGVWLAEYIPSVSFRPASVTGAIPRDIELHQFLGLFFTGARLSFNQGERHFGLSLQCLGADEEAGGAVPDVSSAVFEDPASYLNLDAPAPMTIEISDGVTDWDAFAESVDLSFTWNRRLREPERRLTPTGILGGGVAGASAKIRWPYGTDTDFLLDAIRSRASVSFRLTIQGNSIGSGGFETRESLEIWLPVCKVNGDPPTLRGPGSGNIDFSIDMEPLLSTVDGYPFRFRVVYGDFENELLVNGGFEDELGAEWVEVGTSGWFRQGSGPSPQAGSFWLHPPVSASAEIYQELDVSDWAAWIDTGIQRFTFSGYGQSFNQVPTDTSRFIIEYRDSGGSVLDSYDSAAFSSIGAWLLKTSTMTAPVSTRKIRVRLVSVRNNGTNNDGYYDSLSLKALRLVA